MVSKTEVLKIYKEKFEKVVKEIIKIKNIVK